MVDATDHLAPFVRPSPPTRIALHWFHGLPKSYEPGIQLITQRGTGIQAPPRLPRASCGRRAAAERDGDGRAGCVGEDDAEPLAAGGLAEPDAKSSYGSGVEGGNGGGPQGA
eukprot:scaffold5680_cov122-Isochrysis_galbana.AAC.3